MYSSTFYVGSGIVLSTAQNDLKAGKRVFFLFVLSFSEENVSYFNNNMCYDSHTLHVGDAANCVVVKNGGKNENARLPSLFPDLSRDGISASRGPSRFLLAVVSVPASPCIRIRSSIKVSVHNLKNFTF